MFSLESFIKKKKKTVLVFFEEPYELPLCERFIKGEHIVDFFALFIGVEPVLPTFPSQLLGVLRKHNIMENRKCVLVHVVRKANTMQYCEK